MMSPGSIEGESVSAPLWLITFADLTALLVALFVLIYSMSVPVSLSPNGTGLTQNGTSPGEGAVTSRSNERSSAPSGVGGDLTLGYLAVVFSDRKLSDSGRVGPVTHQVEGNRLVVRFKEAFLFDGARVGTNEGLSSLGADRLGNLSLVLGSVGNPVSIIVPVSEDDWAEAFDRADLVAAAFRRAGYDRAVERFVAPGLKGAGDAGDVMLVIGRQDGGGRT
ncbi:MAG: flagellar motor protein MotB [Parvibaculum sp.]